MRYQRTLLALATFISLLLYCMPSSADFIDSTSVSKTVQAINDLIKAHSSSSIKVVEEGSIIHLLGEAADEDDATLLIAITLSIQNVTNVNVLQLTLPDGGSIPKSC